MGINYPIPHIPLPDVCRWTSRLSMPKKIKKSLSN